MRPEHSRALSQSTGIARAKMYLKQDLGWLAGFPIAQSAGRIEWMLAPRVGHSADVAITIDRERLSRAHFTLAKLVGRFPKAMPKLVGNVAAWEQRVNTLLNAIKSAVHSGVEIGGCYNSLFDAARDEELKLVREIVRKWPTLKPCVDAVLWSTVVECELRPEFLGWLAANADWLTNFLTSTSTDASVWTVLLLADLARSDGVESLKCFRSILGEPLSFLLPTHGFYEYVVKTAQSIGRNNDRSRWPTLPARPSPKIAQVALDFLSWLGPLPTPRRRRTVELLNETLATDRIVGWAIKWNEFDQRVGRELRRIQNLPEKTWAIKYRVEAKRVGQELELQCESLGVGVSAELVFNVVKDLSADDHCSVSQLLLRCLRLLPGMDSMIPTTSSGKPEFRCEQLRVGLLCEMKRLLQRAEDGRWASTFLSAFERHLRDAAGDMNALIPWMRNASTHRVLVQPSWWQSPWLVVLYEEEEPRLLPKCLNAMLELRLESAENEKHVERIQQLVVATRDSAIAVTYFRELVKDGLIEFDDLSFIRLVTRLVTADVGFVPLIRSFEKLGHQRWELRSGIKHVLALQAYFQKLGRPSLVGRLVARGQVKEVFQAAAFVDVAIKLGLGTTYAATPTIPVEQTSWADWYPESLRTLVIELGGADGVNVRRVDSLIGQWWPSRLKLERELNCVAERLHNDSANSSLVRRFENLQQRLRNPQPLPVARLTKLREELTAAIERQLFETSMWVTKQELAWELFGCPRGLLDGELSEYPEFVDQVLGSKPYSELIRGIIGLNAPYRDLAIRLLNRSWRQTPWDLAAEQPNRAFIERMRQRGLRMDAWINDARHSVVTGKHGKKFSLAFESDGVELLLMGYHFGTCLSPDGINFFSAVVNAVDINKRVLFARNANEKVVGRCLFAIGDGGTLLTFHAYCHDEGLDFQRNVARIAQELADELGTVVSKSDRVSPLMTPDWYDDGAMDYGVTIDGQESSLRHVLKTISPGGLIELIEHAFGPTLPMVTRISITVGLDEFKTRPELLPPLLPLLKLQAKSLPTDAQMNVAACADRAGQHELAGRILEQYAFDWLIKCPCLCCFPQREQLRLLSKYRPSVALRVIRHTRRRSVRSDLEEYDESRRELLAEIHESLGRSQLAAQLRRR